MGLKEVEVQTSVSESSQEPGVGGRTLTLTHQSLRGCGLLSVTTISYRDKLSKMDAYTASNKVTSFLKTSLLVLTPVLKLSEPLPKCILTLGTSTI